MTLWFGARSRHGPKNLADQAKCLSRREQNAANVHLSLHATEVRDSRGSKYFALM